MANIPQPDIELLKAALTRPNLGTTIQAGVQGFGTGVDLASKIADQKAKRQKEELALMQEIQKVAAQQQLVQEAQTPIDTKMTLNKPGFKAMSPVELPSGELQAPEGPGREIMPSLFKASKTQEALQKEGVDKKRRMMGLAAQAEPETFAKGLLKEEDQTGAKRFQQGTAELNGQIVNVVFDTSTGTYRGTDGKPLEGSLVRGFKPDIRVDPATEQLLRITTGGTQQSLGLSQQPSQQVEFPEDLTVRQSNRLNELSKRFEDDDIVKTARTSMATIQNLETVQAQGTGALIGSLQSLRARGLAGEKGVLTEADVARTTGSPQLARRFMNVVTKLVAGQENPENVAEFKAALQAVKEASVIRNQQVENEFIKRATSTKELSNVSPELIRRNISIGSSGFQAGPTIAPQYPNETKKTKSGISYKVK